MGARDIILEHYSAAPPAAQWQDQAAAVEAPAALAVAAQVRAQVQEASSATHNRRSRPLSRVLFQPPLNVRSIKYTGLTNESRVLIIPVILSALPPGFGNNQRVE